MRPAVILILIFIAASMAPLAPVSARGESCEEAYQRARAHLEVHADEYDFQRALHFALEELTVPCSLDGNMSGATAAQDRAPSAETPCGPEACEVRQASDPISPVVSTETVPCSESGAGSGTIRGFVLGVEVERSLATGEWVGSGGGLVTVSGATPRISGEQTGDIGTIWVAHLVPLPANGGSSGATCAWVGKTTQAQADEGCFYWYVIFAGGYKCSQSAEAQVELELKPCTGFAQQRSDLVVQWYNEQMVMTLASVTHSYTADPNPCALASPGKVRLG